MDKDRRVWILGWTLFQIFECSWGETALYCFALIALCWEVGLRFVAFFLSFININLKTLLSQTYFSKNSQQNFEARNFLIKMCSIAWVRESASFQPHRWRTPRGDPRARGRFGRPGGHGSGDSHQLWRRILLRIAQSRRRQECLASQSTRRRNFQRHFQTPIPQ